jgi:hypothetical protein
MKINGLLIGVVVLAALAGALFWSNRHQPAADAGKTSADAPPKILNLNPDDITKFDLKMKGAEQAVVAKDGSGNWQVTAPVVLPAAPDVISAMKTAVATLTAERLVDDKPSDLKQYGLAAPAQETDIITKDGKTHVLLFGDDAPAGQATYAMLGGDSRVFTVPGHLKDIVNRTPRDLRDKQLITLDPDKISHVEVTTKQQMEFVRDKGHWQLAQPTVPRLDGTEIDSFVDGLEHAQIDVSALDQDVKTAAAAFASGTLVATAKVTADSGTQLLQLRKNKDAYYAKTSLGEDVYKVSPQTGQQIAKTPDDFRNKKLFDFGDEDPDKIEMRDAAKTYVLTKSGGDWLWNGNKVDAGGALDLVGQLRSLVASKFDNAGFTAPSIGLTVTSGGGKRVEKVQISKSAAGAIGKREGDPALYDLNVILVDEIEKSAADMKPAEAAK